MPRKYARVNGRKTEQGKKFYRIASKKAVLALAFQQLFSKLFLGQVIYRQSILQVRTFQKIFLFKTFTM